MSLPNESYDKHLLADLDSAVLAAREMFESNMHNRPESNLGDLATKVSLALERKLSLEEQEQMLQEKIDKLVKDISSSERDVDERKTAMLILSNQFMIEPSINDPTQLVINLYNGTKRLTSLNFNEGVFKYSKIKELSVPAELQITKLVCNSLEMERLKEVPVSLVELNCSNNMLNDLPGLPETLQILKCDHNQLDFLPIKLPGSLKELTASYNYFDMNELDRIKKMHLEKIIL